jgi:hypothetical protein
MRLSAEMYEQIVASLKSDSHRDKDKRREPRVGMAAEADFVTVTEAGKRIAGVVRVRDVSARGIGLFLSKQIDKHQRFVLQLYTTKQEPVWLVCQAAYCRQVDGGRFSVGAKIHQLLRADQIQKVEAQPAAEIRGPARQHAKMGPADIERISKAILG